MAMLKKNPMKRMKLEKLREERYGFERRGKILTKEIQALSNQRRKLFEKGFDKKLTDAAKRGLSDDIRNADIKLKQKELRHKKNSYFLAVVDGMIFIKENEQELKDTPFMKKITNMPPDQLERFLTSVNVQETVRDRKIDRLKNIFDTEYEVGMEAIEDDENTKQLMDIWSAGQVSDIDEEYEKWSQTKEEEIEEIA